MLETSVYIIDCCNPDCVKRNIKIRSATLNAKCKECGLEIRVESWQIRHTASDRTPKGGDF